MDEITIDVGKLHDDLLNYFGTMWFTLKTPFGSGALADIDTMFETGNYQGLVDLALHEGFKLADYEVT